MLDREIANIALEKSLEYWGDNASDSSSVIATAQKFYEFLSGNDYPMKIEK